MQSNSFSNRLYKALREHTVYYIYLPLVIYWITLFILTTIPTAVVPQLFDEQDKFEHFGAYLLLAVLLTLSLHMQKRFSILAFNAFLFSLIFVLLYGAVDELHQLFVPGRYCDFYDWLADAIGGSIGVLCVYVFLRGQRSEKSIPPEHQIKDASTF